MFWTFINGNLPIVSNIYCFPAESGWWNPHQKGLKEVLRLYLTPRPQALLDDCWWHSANCFLWAQSPVFSFSSKISPAFGLQVLQKLLPSIFQVPEDLTAYQTLGKAKCLEWEHAEISSQIPQSRSYVKSTPPVGFPALFKDHRRGS